MDNVRVYILHQGKKFELESIKGIEYCVEAERSLDRFPTGVSGTLKVFKSGWERFLTTLQDPVWYFQTFDMDVYYGDKKGSMTRVDRFSGCLFSSLKESLCPTREIVCTLEFRAFTVESIDLTPTVKPSESRKGELDNWFSYHAPEGDDQSHYKAIREAGRRFAAEIIDHTPAGPEQDSAVQDVRRAVMMANASVACRKR